MPWSAPRACQACARASVVSGAHQRGAQPLTSAAAGSGGAAGRLIAGGAAARPRASPRADTAALRIALRVQKAQGVSMRRCLGPRGEAMALGVL